MRGMAGAKCHSRPPGVASWAARRPPSCVAVLSRVWQLLLWLAASGQGQQGSAQSRLAPPWPGQRTHGMGRGRAAAGRRELMRPASAIVSAWMSVPPRSQMLPWWGVLGAGCWVKLGVRPISAREAVPLAALRAALDLDALPA
jgi:hypothetical protein